MNNEKSNPVFTYSSTVTTASRPSNPSNPFDVIPRTSTENVKIWDFPGFDIDGNEGRIRVLAMVPRLPSLLVNIKFAVAWCAPEDLHKFTRAKANTVLVGRYLKASRDNSWHTMKNVGCLAFCLDTLKDFPVEVINYMETKLDFRGNCAIPNWVHKFCTSHESIDLWEVERPLK